MREFFHDRRVNRAGFTNFELQTNIVLKYHKALYVVTLKSPTYLNTIQVTTGVNATLEPIFRTTKHLIIDFVKNLLAVSQLFSDHPIKLLINVKNYRRICLLSANTLGHRRIGHALLVSISNFTYHVPHRHTNNKQPYHLLTDVTTGHQKLKMTLAMVPPNLIT